MTDNVNTIELLTEQMLARRRAILSRSQSHVLCLGTSPPAQASRQQDYVTVQMPLQYEK
jgi:hypothetical protein